MAHDVFLSYSSQDKPIAEAVCGTLEGKRIPCWVAPRDVLPGFRQVGGADRFVVRLHERLGQKPPCDHPEVEADKRAAIETKLEKLC